jgi:CheY-like chemotaxis protein
VGAAARRRRRVLVVDDEAGVLRVIVAVLAARPDLSVQVAAGGIAALRLVAQDPPDLILLDLRLPDLAGDAVCRRLKTDPATRPIPIVAVTAGLAPATLGAVGFDDHLPKPFRVRALLATVDRWLRP